MIKSSRTIPPIHHHQQRHFPSKLVLVALNSAFIFGYQLADINAVAPVAVTKLIGNRIHPSTLETTSPVDSQEGKLLIAIASGCFFCGTALGALLGGHLSDTFGRKFTSGISYLLYVIGTILELLLMQMGTLFNLNRIPITGGLTTYCSGRLLNGIALGISHVVVLTYLLEAVPRTQLRGKYGILFQVLITFGIVVPNLAAVVMRDDGMTRNTADNTAVVNVSPFNSMLVNMILALPLLLAILGLVMVPSLVESPVYIMMRPDLQPNIDTVLQKLDSEFSVTPAQVPHPRVSELKAIANQAHHSSPRENKHLLPVRDDQMAFSTPRDGGGPMSEADLQRTSLNRSALFLALTFVILVQTTCVNVVLSTSNLQLSRVGFSPSAGYKISCLLTLFNFVLTLPAIMLVDKLGRITLVRISAIICAIGGAVVLTSILSTNSVSSTKWFSLCGLLIFLAGFAVGTGAVMFLYINEILPAEVRTSANGIIVCVNWITCGITVVGGSLVAPLIVYPVMIGGSAILFLYSLSLPETKGCPFGISPLAANYDKLSDSQPSNDSLVASTEPHN